MQLKKEALASIDSTRRFFDRSTSALEEADSAFRASAETMTVAGQFAHVAQTIDWFREGALEDRWNMDFEAANAAAARVTSLSAARRDLAEAWERLRKAIEALPEEKLAEPMAENPILPPKPRFWLVEALVDHTGHHRGALAVYTRLLGKVPPMPYGEG